MPHCEKCGHEYGFGAKFCAACGAPLGAVPPPPPRESPRAPGDKGKAFGVASVILGALTFGVQFLGGLCCGWIGWPLAFAAVICGILAIAEGESLLGWLGIGLSGAMLVLQILFLILGVGSLGSLLR
jgi:hypothetical protein